MTGNPSGPMNLAENPLPRSHAHGRRHENPPEGGKSSCELYRRFGDMQLRSEKEALFGVGPRRGPHGVGESCFSVRT